MKRICLVLSASMFLWTSTASVAVADTFGGDLLLLGQILSNTVQQLVQLRQILGNGKDTLNLMRDINSGLREALNLSKINAGRVDPGILSELRNVQETMQAVEKLYGLVPRTPEAALQKTTDQTVAEALDMHNAAFRYAAQIDPQAQQIKDRANFSNPQGAAKLTAQSVGVAVSVMNEVLRTNATMLKLQGEQLALANRREKLASEQFRAQYDGLAKAFGTFHPSYDLAGTTR